MDNIDRPTCTRTRYDTASRSITNIDCVPGRTYICYVTEPLLQPQRSFSCPFMSNGWFFVVGGYVGNLIVRPIITRAAEEVQLSQAIQVRG